MADVTVAGCDAATAPSIGKTGVHLRWHKYSEYRALTKEQKAELYEWQQNNPDAVAALKANHQTQSKPPQKKAKRTNGPKSSMSKKLVSKMVAKQVAKAMGQSTEDAKEEDNLRKYLMSMVEVALKDAAVKPPVASAAAATKDPETAPKGLL